MDSGWFIAYLVLAGTAVVQALMLLLHAYEHCRYSRSCMRTIPRRRPEGRAMVLVPCKGFDLDLEDNLLALLRQDYDDYEVTFVVETAEDPAYPVIQRVMARHPRVAARLLVAGRAVDCGQKIHNLRAATARLPGNVRYLAFADSDARPRPHWLRVAISHLHRPYVGATTGYRWFVPERASLPNLLLYSINSNIMSLMGADNHYMLWGGSWAINRDIFDEIGLRAAWQGMVSDDLVAGGVLRRAPRRLYVRFEPACVVASPVDHSFLTMFEFVRRQYLICRYYAPGWWLLALASTSIRNLAWPATLAAAGLSLCCGKPPLWIPAACGMGMYLAGAARAWMVQRLARTYFPEHYDDLRAARWFDIWAGPVAAVVHWLALLSSSVGRHITWRGTVYRLHRGGQVTIGRRDEELEIRETPLRKAA